ncbi:uncharacterized protein peak3 [Osmerus eperlanus]|uniref:uncharacterized protein peak3 n=1 Tax=Osmerus eperlanus TaxID=29151 RepID=UPI002E168392
METRTSPAERQRPPALPVKQRRSMYSSSSADLEGGLWSPRVSQLHSPNADVFSEPTDCQAALCPIHQRYDPSLCHQERFFSDSCPPPVPKKSLVRTLSLPGGYLCPLSPCPMSPGLSPIWPQPLSPGWSPLPPAPHSPRSYDNPLYMITSAPAPQQRPVQPPPPTLLPLSQLSFDTPDRLLPHFFCSLASHASVSRGLQQRHLLFLRSVAERLEAGQLLGGGDGGPGGALQPQDLLLWDCRPRQIGGALYYRLHSAVFPGKVLAAKVSRGADSSPHPPPCPPHINIQQVLAHFPPQSDLCPSPPQEPSPASQPGRSTPLPPHEGAVESAGCLKRSRETREPSVASLLQTGCRVTLERDLPRATLEDFAEEGRGLGGAEGRGYERQLGVLLLQLARGLQVLDGHGACTCVELHPRDAQFGAIIQHCLHLQEAASPCSGSPSLPQTGSPYRPGLQQLSGWLREEGSGLQIGDTVGILQVLLWGPRARLFSLHPAGGGGAEGVGARGVDEAGAGGGAVDEAGAGAETSIVCNWLSVKRALLVLKLAEKGFHGDQSGLDWEDFLCLHYLSQTDPESVLRATARLGLHNIPN